MLFFILSDHTSLCPMKGPHRWCNG